MNKYIYYSTLYDISLKVTYTEIWPVYSSKVIAFCCILDRNYWEKRKWKKLALMKVNIIHMKMTLKIHMYIFINSPLLYHRKEYLLWVMNNSGILLVWWLVFVSLCKNTLNTLILDIKNRLINLIKKQNKLWIEYV